ncbi:expressed unknown protein [Seminavis robusta]|uniref:Uncharacterized protein n=1 Tax=Seminavis robusta TaxID=568900 RepID=A0A9N8EWC7_9STRA|nr:expressed unknown protein [Seminavis robusta]|eukprot:Sro1884_g303511.1  (115) ;mRNA; r:16770-17114
MSLFQNWRCLRMPGCRCFRKKLQMATCSRRMMEKKFVAILTLAWIAKHACKLACLGCDAFLSDALLRQHRIHGLDYGTCTHSTPAQVGTNEKELCRQAFPLISSTSDRPFLPLC